MLGLGGISEAAVGEKDGLRIEREVGVKVVVVGKINGMKRVGKGVGGGGLGEKEDRVGVWGEWEKGIGGKWGEGGGMVWGMMEGVVGDLEDVGGVVLVLVVVVVEWGGGLYELVGRGCGRGVG